MIHREATIKYKRYDPDDLLPHSMKRVCMICEDCGRVRWGSKDSYRDLCLQCAMKNFKSENNVMFNSEIRRKQKEGAKKRSEDPEWRRKQKDGSIKRSKNEGYRKKQRNALLIYGQSNIGKKEYKERGERFAKSGIAKEAAIKRSKDPDFGKKISAGIQGKTLEKWSGFIDQDWRDWSKAIYLNDWFPGCERHHLTKTLVACIPKELHDHMKPHCLETGFNMEEINMIALQFIYGGYHG